MHKLLPLLLLSACVSEVPRGPPCLVGFEQVGPDWFVLLDRNPGPGYASGSFRATAHLFLSGGTEVVPATLYIGADTARVKIPPPDGMTISSVYASYCEAQ